MINTMIYLQLYVKTKKQRIKGPRSTCTYSMEQIDDSVQVNIDAPIDDNSVGSSRQYINLFSLMNHIYPVIPLTDNIDISMHGNK